MVKVLKNEEKQGIELYFDVKPTKEVLDYLKNSHFRWHNAKKCWYAKENQNTLEVTENVKNNKIVDVPRGTSENKNGKNNMGENELGIKVGDIFYSSWGYEQTNVDFFRVKELRGKTQVVIQEISLKMLTDEGISGMSSDRTYDKNVYSIRENSVFIKDNEKGEIKKVLGTKKNPYLNLASFANAYLYNGEKLYESWYY